MMTVRGYIINFESGVPGVCDDGPDKVIILFEIWQIVEQPRPLSLHLINSKENNLGQTIKRFLFHKFPKNCKIRLEGLPLIIERASPLKVS